MGWIAIAWDGVSGVYYLFTARYGITWDAVKHGRGGLLLRPADAGFEREIRGMKRGCLYPKPARNRPETGRHPADEPSTRCERARRGRCGRPGSWWVSHARLGIIHPIYDFEVAAPPESMDSLWWKPMKGEQRWNTTLDWM